MEEKPNRLASAGKWALGVAGASVIFAAQTRPEDATSSIAAWLHFIGIDQVPNALASTSADSWATAIGAFGILAASLLWWRGKLRKRRRLAPAVPVEAEAHGMPSIEEMWRLIAPERTFGETIMNRIIETTPLPAPRRDEIHFMMEKKAERAVEAALKPKFDMPLRDVLKRIAFDSQWAVTRDFSSPRDHWQEPMWEVPLGKELMRPLASGDVPARGIRSTSDGDEHGHSDIPASFWLNPKLDPHADRLLCEPGYDFVMNFAEGYAYHDIRLCAADVNRLWPSRSAEEIEANPSLFIACAEEWKACYDERMVNAELDYDRSQALGQADRFIPFIELRKIAPEYGLSLESNDSPTANLAYEIEGALREAAARQDLAVEGRKYRGPIKSNDPLLPIPPDHFKDYEFRHGRLHYQTDNEITGTSTLQLLARGVDGVENVTFYDLHLSERGARAVLAKVAAKQARQEQDQQTGLPDWMEGRTRLTIGEAGCLATRVSPLKFKDSAKAQSKANDLRYYVMHGRIPVAGESPAILAARRGVGAGRGVEVPEVTFDTFVTVRDLEHFLDKSLALWLDVQEEATWRARND